MAISTPSQINVTTNTSSDATSFTNAAFTPTAGGLLIVVIATLDGASTSPSYTLACTATDGNQGAFSIAGQRIATNVNSRSSSVTAFVSQTGPSPASGTVTVTMSGTNARSDRTVLWVGEITGQDTTSAIGATGNAASTVDNITVTLSATSASNSMVFGVLACADDTSPANPTPGLTQVYEGSSGGSTVTNTLSIVGEIGAISSASWTTINTVNNVAAAFEIKADATATYTLTADPGSYTLTGQAASLLVSRLLAAEAASFTLTGQAAGLYLNPTTFIDGFGGDVFTAKDMQMSAGWPTNNGGGHANFQFSTTQRSLLEFDLSSIPTTATITDAILYLYHSYTPEGGFSPTVSIHSMSAANAAWIAGDNDITLADAGEPCWNALAADGAGGVTTAWAGSEGASTAGTDYETPAIGSFVFDPDSAIGTEFSAHLDTTRVQGWVGASNTNYGLILISSANSGHVAQSSNATTAYRPKLVVTYYDPPSGGPTYTLTADAGTYTLTGQTASLLAARILAADAGAYTLAGQSAGLLAHRVLSADAGSYTMTGEDVALLAARKLTADPGAYNLTGTDVSLLAHRILTAGAGAFVLAGSDAALLVQRVLQAAAGSYTLTGADVGLLTARRMTAEAGSYILTGLPVTLLYSGDVTPTPATRVYVIPLEDRVFIITAESRTHAVDAEDRTFEIRD